MYFDTIIAGFGGQGVMLIGNLLASAGMEAGKQVTYMPVYGVEMRGGTANCTVVVSDKPVGSPVIHAPVSAVVMNRPSAEKFGPRVSKDGLLVVNASLVEKRYARTKAQRRLMVPALDLANEAGSSRLANMVMLGALCQAGGVLDVEKVVDTLPKALAKRYHKMIPINSQGLRLGAKFAAENLG